MSDDGGAERVERTDIGASVQATLKRGSGTRDQDEVRIKGKGEDAEQAITEFEQLLERYETEFGADHVSIWPGGVDMDETEAPGPRPADLFEASPDPLLYYDTAGGAPVVRAGNPAFEATFGVADDTLDGTALPAALGAADGDDITSAATAGKELDAVRRCETADSAHDLRIRVVPVGDGTRGYVMCTGPVDGG